MIRIGIRVKHRPGRDRARQDRQSWECTPPGDGRRKCKLLHLAYIVTEIYEPFRAAGAIPLTTDMATNADIEQVRREIGMFKAKRYRAHRCEGVEIVTMVVALLRLLP